MNIDIAAAILQHQLHTHLLIAKILPVQTRLKELMLIHLLFAIAARMVMGF